MRSMFDPNLEFSTAGSNTVGYGASGAPKNTAPWPRSPPRPAERHGAGSVILGFCAPAPGPARSPDGPRYNTQEDTGPHPGNERGLTLDAGGAGITPKITPPACCKGGAWRLKTRPAPPCNEL